MTKFFFFFSSRLVLADKTTSYLFRLRNELDQVRRVQHGLFQIAWIEFTLGKPVDTCSTRFFHLDGRGSKPGLGCRALRRAGEEREATKDSTHFFMPFYDDYLTIHTLLTHSPQLPSLSLTHYLDSGQLGIFDQHSVSVSHMWARQQTGFSSPACWIAWEKKKKHSKISDFRRQFE